MNVRTAENKERKIIMLFLSKIKNTTINGLTTVIELENGITVIFDGNSFSTENGIEATAIYDEETGDLIGFLSSIELG